MEHTFTYEPWKFIMRIAYRQRLYKFHMECNSLVRHPKTICAARINMNISTFDHKNVAILSRK